MRLIPLIFLTLLLSGCVFGPVEDFVDQMDDQYFADEFNSIPTEIKPYNKKASIELIWENKVGDNDINNLNLIFSEEFVIAATSNGSIRKQNTFRAGYILLVSDIFFWVWIVAVP